MPEIKQRVRLALACQKRFRGKAYDMEAAPAAPLNFALKVLMLKGRGCGNSAVRVRDVDPRQGALH